MDNLVETEEQRKKRIKEMWERLDRSIARNGGYMSQTCNGGIVSSEFIPNRQYNRGRDD